MDVVKDGHVHRGSQISYGTYYLLTSFSNYMNDKTRFKKIGPTIILTKEEDVTILA